MSVDPSKDCIVTADGLILRYGDEEGCYYFYCKRKVERDKLSDDGLAKLAAHRFLNK